MNNLSLEEMNFSAFDITLLNPTERSVIISWLQEILQSNSKIAALQSFKFNSILNEKHLFSAVHHSWNGYKNKYMISNSLSVEFLVYLSGQRQISKAFQNFGLPETTEKFSLLVFHTTTYSSPNSLLKSNSFNKLVVSIESLAFTDSIQKRKQLAKQFEFNYSQDEKFLESETGFRQLENFILSSISNVVFESSKLENNNK